ncbi:fungal-specific transcription factor domain-containing protein [Exophiala viscosa]|uniref:Fungal-specific transcription factor domain-containing protein n=1 Tax=Exophiala viscosa TaxID=2486360 RepID=A0AAN6E4E3_9EURO|nr:fungal-specific transcription factor domain-containing protein [Exophiala viscosa]
MDARTWPSVEDDVATRATVAACSMPDVSCEACRRRKAKCDRKVPSCSLCLKSSQECSYPSKRLRPGPKTGSIQKKPRVSKNRKPQTRGQEDSARRSNSGSNQDEFSMISDSQVSEELNHVQPQAPANLPLSPETTTAATTVANRADIATKASCFDVNFHVAADNFVSNVTHWSHPVSQAPAREDLINLSMGNSDAILHTSHALNISPAVLEELIDSYFSNMTSFSLFHRPTFAEKLKLMGPSLYLHALLASMCSVSARFTTDSEEQAPSDPFNAEPSSIPCADHFHQVALRFEEESLTQCSDGTPPLEFLQAIILTTFFQLTKGVHGRAWRWLGTCIRVAYELNLHCIDAYKQEDYVPSTAAETLAWSRDEERRRCWWAVWEMDCFASTLRRVPTGLSWSQNKTFLPVEDRLWYRQNFHPSCILAAKPGDRWQFLQRSGNESPVAWNIVVISLSRDAQTISHLEGAFNGFDAKGQTTMSTSDPTSEADRAAHSADDELEIISHTLQCTLLALPDALQYHNESLRFTSVDCNQTPVSSMLHSAKYSIYVMTELTKFMIAHYYTFSKGNNLSGRLQSNADIDRIEANPLPGTLLMCTTRKPNMEGLKQYIEASNNIVMLLNRCTSTHVRYVNPFLATTIWLAATVQLLNKKFGPSGGNRDLAEAKFNTLRLTYKQFVRFWNTPAGLLHSLDSLEEKFDRLLGGQPTSTAKPTNAASIPEEHRREQLFRMPDMPTCFSGSSASQKQPSASYTSALTEPNLTGSGVNPMMSSLVHASHAIEEQRQHNVQDFGPSTTQLRQPGISNRDPDESQGEEIDTGIRFDERLPADPMLESMEFPLNFDYDPDTDVTVYLNSLLSGSYSGNLGPS